MANNKDRIGARTGTLTVIAQAGWKPLWSGRRVRLWRFRCDCGHELEAPFHLVEMGSRICRACTNPQVEDLSEWKHGKLRVKSFAGVRGGHAYWTVVCVECAKAKEILGSSLKQRVTPCFCTPNAATHGQSKTGTYRAWNAMLQRCTNPNYISYPNYGARGISVCARWHTFETFLADMGERPANSSLDRKDNNKNYEPSNCRWATRTQQNRNTRRNISITWKGETMSLQDWSDKLGWSRHVLHNRYHRNWSLERMMTTPPSK